MGAASRCARLATTMRRRLDSRGTTLHCPAMYRRTGRGTWLSPLRFSPKLAFILLFCGTTLGYCAASPVYGGFFGTRYLQSGNTLMPHPTGSAAWECWVRDVPAGQVTETTVWTPSDEDITCYPGAQGAYVGIALPSTIYRDMMFPPGTYRIEEALADEESRTNSLVLAAGTAPPAPTVQNGTEWTQWPAGQTLTLTWKAGAGTLGTDTFVVSLEDLTGVQRYLETPMPGQSGALSGTATSSTIPGQYLTTNGTYYVRLSCYRSQGTGGLLTGQYSATLLMLVVTGAGLEDVAAYHFVSGRVFTQDSTNQPALAATNAYRAEAQLRGISAGWVNAASVQAPGLPVQALTPDMDELVWTQTAAFASETALTSTWPSGSYRWTVDGEIGGSQESDLAVTTGGWPAPLRVLNLDVLRTNTFEDDTVLSWAPTGTVAATDRIEFAVFNSAGDVVLQVPDPDYDDPIPGTNTSLTIDSGSLSSGVEYTGSLRYLRMDQWTTNTLGGAEAISGRFAETRFPIGRYSSPTAPELEVLTTNLPSAAVAEDYDTQLVAVGGTRPYTWTLLSGTLPAGLTLESSGAVRGIPAAAGTNALVFMVADDTTNSVQQPLSLVITGTIPALTIATTNLPAVQGSWPYLVELASGGGLAPFTWGVVSGQLPPGLELDTNEGVIAGSPTRAGAFTFVVRLSDGSGQSQQRTFSLTVPALDSVPLAVTGFELTNATTGQLTLSADVGDPVSIEHSTDNINWVSVLTTDYPTNGLLEWTGLGGPYGFYRARWGQTPPDPSPAAPVIPDIDTNLVASGTLTFTGNSTFALTNAAGHIYRLDIPSNAAPYKVDIQMQYVRALGACPFPNGYYGGVEFRPGGLTFRQPATLTVTFPGGVPSDYTPIAYDSDGVEPHLCLTARQDNSVVFPIWHFSGVGGAAASAAQASQFANDKKPCPTPYLGEQLLVEALYRLAGSSGEVPSAEALAPYLKQWFEWSVWPGLKMAQTDDQVLDYATSEYLTWVYDAQLMGLEQAAENLAANPPSGEPSDGQRALLSIARYLEKAPPVLARGFANALVQAHVRTVTEKDPWVAVRIIDYARQAALLGLDALLPQYLSSEAAFERFERVWRFELEIESVIDAARTDGSHFVTQVRSGRCPIEYDGTNPSAWALLKGSQTNVNLVSWEYIMPNGSRVRPVIEKGWLQTFALWIDPIYAKETGASGEEDCRQPKAPKFPIDAKITTMFNVGDPVKTMLVQTGDGSWVSHPVGGSSWELLLQGLHAMNGEYISSSEFVDNVFVVATKWRYVGGTPFAEATYEETRTVNEGSATERSLLELFFAPKPLRQSDTQLPNP